MVKYLKYLPLAAFFIPALASAQTFPKPPDVPDYVQIDATYASGATANVLGDNSTTWGGTAPYIASGMPADISSSSTGWLTASGVVSCVTVPVTCPEAKFRSAGNTTHILFDDPIRNYGLPGTSHCHQFFGNARANAYSTFARLRNSVNSYPGTAAVAGGPLNGTGYWFPCPVKTNPFSDGKNYAVRANLAIIYYTENPGSNNIYVSRIPRGLRYVAGYPMDDPTNAIITAEIAAANAQPGTAGRYSALATPYRWVCTDTGDTVPYLKTTGGADAFATLGTGTCPGGTNNLLFEIDAPPCWDGTNPWSPGGYKHMRYKIHDNTLGTDVCPNGWYQLPQLIIKAQFTHSGFSDYGDWRLSSDDQAAAACGCTVANGASLHNDWFGAWDDTTFMKWQDFCVGVNGQTAHQCDSSTIGSAERMIGGLVSENAPDSSRVPQVNFGLSYGTASAASMFQLPSTSSGPAVINQHQ